MNRAAASALLETPFDAGARTRTETEQLGGSVLLPGDSAYPALLADIDEPPPALFVLGDLPLLQREAVAIVGSRDHTPYGGEVAAAIARGAGTAGLVVVSGMARGLDAVAHTVALETGAGTIGVLGNGFGVVYPAANRALYQAVQGRGLLLTEHPPGERPHAGSFPKRNRLIAGLARVTVVVEAGPMSGALTTARAALEQGREVMAVPGPVTSVCSVGTNRLLRDGATPLLELADLLRCYPGWRPSPGPETGVLAADRASPQSLVLAVLRGGPRHVDELGARLTWQTGTLLALLGAMEIAGVVVQGPGMIFSLAQARFAAEAPVP
jgi:DNA processing protein